MKPRYRRAALALAAVAAGVSLILVALDQASPSSATGTEPGAHGSAAAPSDGPVAYPGGAIITMEVEGTREAFAELGIADDAAIHLSPPERAMVYRALQALAANGASAAPLDPEERRILARLRELVATDALRIPQRQSALIAKVQPEWPRFGDAASAAALVRNRLGARRPDSGPAAFAILSIDGAAGFDTASCSSARPAGWTASERDVVLLEDTDEPTPLALAVAAQLRKDGEQVVVLRRGETYVLPLTPSAGDRSPGALPCAVQIIRGELPPGSIHGPALRGSG